MPSIGNAGTSYEAMSIPSVLINNVAYRELSPLLIEHKLLKTQGMHDSWKISSLPFALRPKSLQTRAIDQHQTSMRCLSAVAGCRRMTNARDLSISLTIRNSRSLRFLPRRSRHGARSYLPFS